jgi:S1-C subfamily serine protease
MKRQPVYVHVNMGFLALLLILFMGIFATGLFLAPQLQGSTAQAAPQLQGTLNGDDLLATYEQALVEVYQDSLPSVVNIRVTVRLDANTLERFGFGGPDDPEEDNPDEEGPDPEDLPDFFNQAGGSGFIWDDQGYIVTNNHVVANAEKIEVIFADDTVRIAELIGTDPNSDLAVIKVDLPPNAKASKLGDSAAIQVGQLAIALGNPFGQDFTMTTGIVSGVGRLIQGLNSGFSIPEVIQTDAPINPGNSGGPLLNREGEVIGINTQILSRTGVNTGVGFAVPINIAKKVVPKLIAGEAYEYAWLGIGGATITTDVNEFRKLPLDTKGALVFSVVEEGPAAEAGLKGRDTSLTPDDEAYRYSGEIVTAINGEPVHGIEDLITYLVAQVKPGDVVTLDVIQEDGTASQVKVTLGVRPNASE